MTGTGKTVTVQNLLSSLEPSEEEGGQNVVPMTVNFSAQTSSLVTQVRVCVAGGIKIGRVQLSILRIVFIMPPSVWIDGGLTNHVQCCAAPQNTICLQYGCRRRRVQRTVVQ